MDDQITRQEDATGEPAKPEGLLYHYTTPRGLIGIIQQKCIWATHARYLNDRSEGRIAWDVLVDKFLDAGPSIEASDLSQGLSTAAWAVSQHVYVTSFSARGNLLNQWITYSAKEGGFSIGFKQDYLRKIGQLFLQVREDKFYYENDPLGQCIYCDEAARNVLEHEFESCVAAYKNELESARRAQVEEGLEGLVNPGALAMNHFVYAGKKSAFTKDEGFQYEHEWRLAFLLNQNLVPKDIKFRPGSYTPIPYLEIPLCPNGIPIGIENIIVGPNPYQDEAVDSIKMLLVREGMEYVEVVKSKIPYRNLSIPK